MVTPRISAAAAPPPRSLSATAATRRSASRGNRPTAGRARRGRRQASRSDGLEAGPSAGSDDAPRHWEVGGQEDHVRLRVRVDEGAPGGRRAGAVVAEAAVPAWLRDLDRPMHHVAREHYLAGRRADADVDVTRRVSRGRLELQPIVDRVVAR